MTNGRPARPPRWIAVAAWIALIGACSPTEGDGGCPNPDGCSPADGGAPTDAGVNVSLIETSIQGEVLFANNYPGQIADLFDSTFNSGSALGRVRLFARFCTDSACNNPIALVEAEQVENADSDGYTVITTASTTGAGFGTSFVIPQAPAGTSYMQLIGDTQFSSESGKGVCSSLADCPGDADAVQMDGYVVQVNTSGAVQADVNPAGATIEITPSPVGVVLDETLYLGHISFDGDELWEPRASSDPGRLLATMSNADNTFRNFVAILDLEDASSNNGSTTNESYILQKNGADFEGNICGMVRGGDMLYAIGVDSAGANIFSLNATTGTQSSDTPIVVIPPQNPADPATYPWPCRGVHAELGGDEHLYLIHFKGAGSEHQSTPHPFVHVNVTDGTYTTPFDAELGEWAVRGLVIDEEEDILIGVDMSWSKDNQDNANGENRLLPIVLDASGTPILGTAIDTGSTSDDKCDSQLNWVSGLALVDVGGTRQLLVGHDDGVLVYDPFDLEGPTYGLDLTGFGRLFSQVAVSPDGTRGYALPQCKALTANSDFELPYGASTEASDKNLVAILDLSGSSVAVASTNIDINSDGTADDGIDLDFYRIKNYIRSFNSTLPIPPVVYTGPQIAVGENLLFVRGTGINGDGSDNLSSSGLGQVQDIGFFNLDSGHGVVFNQYLPWFNALSSNAGAGPGIWGYDVNPGTETSVSWVEYLP